MKLDTEERFGVVNDTLICLIICICEQYRPVRWKRVCINGKTMVLRCNKAALCSMVYTWNIVSSVSISTKGTKKILVDQEKSSNSSIQATSYSVGFISVPLLSLALIPPQEAILQR